MYIYLHIYIFTYIYLHIYLHVYVHTQIRVSTGWTCRKESSHFRCSWRRCAPALRLHYVVSAFFTESGNDVIFARNVFLSGVVSRLSLNLFCVRPGLWVKADNRLRGGSQVWYRYRLVIDRCRSGMKYSSRLRVRRVYRWCEEPLSFNRKLKTHEYRWVSLINKSYSTLLLIIDP